MFDFIQSFLEEVGIGLGAFIIALAIWIKDIFDKRIAVEHQKEIDKLKTILQEKEHFYQISKEEYQILFQKKIEFYRKLIDIKIKLSNFEQSFSLHSEDDVDWNDYFNFINKFKLEINSDINKLVISKELDETFSDFYSEWLHLEREIEKMEYLYEKYNSQNKNIDDYEAISDKKSNMIESFFLQDVNRKKYETFLQQIDNDIENIKNHINNASLE